jgi:hypothetical protein
MFLHMHKTILTFNSLSISTGLVSIKGLLTSIKFGASLTEATSCISMVVARSSDTKLPARQPVSSRQLQVSEGDFREGMETVRYGESISSTALELPEAPMIAVSNCLRLYALLQQVTDHSQFPSQPHVHAVLLYCWHSPTWYVPCAGFC